MNAFLSLLLFYFCCAFLFFYFATGPLLPTASAVQHNLQEAKYFDDL
jgi:hypothetical protein